MSRIVVLPNGTFINIDQVFAVTCYQYLEEGLYMYKVHGLSVVEVFEENVKLIKESRDKLLLALNWL